MSTPVEPTTEDPLLVFLPGRTRKRGRRLLPNQLRLADLLRLITILAFVLVLTKWWYDQSVAYRTLRGLGAAVDTPDNWIEQTRGGRRYAYISLAGRTIEDDDLVILSRVPD